MKICLIKSVGARPPGPTTLAEYVLINLNPNIDCAQYFEVFTPTNKNINYEWIKCFLASCNNAKQQESISKYKSILKSNTCKIQDWLRN